MDSDTLIEGLRRYGVPHDRIAATIKRDRTAATKMLGGTRSVKAQELEPLKALLAEYEREAGDSEIARRDDNLQSLFDDGLVIDYVPVDILPTYAGAGGGGTGDAERRKALLPRKLVQELHAAPDDLLVIEIRGTSMEPDFKQGDQIVVDKRDRNTRFGGPFAIFDGDTYILKNVERLPGEENQLRVFSSNAGFGEWIVPMDQVRIEGRPVWYARRL